MSFNKSDAALEYEKRADQVKKGFKEVFWYEQGNIFNMKMKTEWIQKHEGHSGFRILWCGKHWNN